MSSVNNAQSTSTRCKCRWLTLARAPGLLKPIRNRLACSLASSDNENSRATSLSTWGEFRCTSGQIRQWLRVSGLLLTRKLIRWPSKRISKRCSSALVLLKLKASGSKAGRTEVILCGGRRRVVLFSFNYKGQKANEWVERISGENFLTTWIRKLNWPLVCRSFSIRSGYRNTFGIRDAFSHDNSNCRWSSRRYVEEKSIVVVVDVEIKTNYS